MESVRALWWVVVWPVLNVAVAVASLVLDISSLATFYLAPAGRPAAFPFVTWAIVAAVFMGLVLFGATFMTVFMLSQKVPPGE